MNVLSLFDGMSCGQIALNRAGIKYDNYYASEIKTHAIKVTQNNYPDTKQLGSVTSLLNIDWNVSKIDLLIGGSPCQDFSILNKNILGLDGKKSGLFWEYFRVLKEIQKVNPGVKFLLENVKMKKEHEKQITDLLQVEPIFIDSKLVSAAHRKRLYWTNIGGGQIQQPKDKNIKLKDILQSGYVSRDKSVCIVKNYARSVQSSNKDSFIKMCESRSRKGFLTVVYEEENNKNSVRLFNRNELEALQTIPKGYTDCVNYYDCADLIGDGWTVDVIAHIFSYLKK